MENRQPHDAGQRAYANANANARGRSGFRVVSEDGPTDMRTILPDAPDAAEGLAVPDGYVLSAEGTYLLKSYTRGGTVPQHIASAPILIVGRLRDIETGDEYLRVAWRRDGWHESIESRANLMDARTLVKLAGKGFPVTSGSAGDVSRYLDAFEHANLDLLPLERVSRHLGWQGDRGRYGFLWGHTHLPPTTSDSDGVAAPIVTFRGASTGDEQLARGFRANGTLEGWLDAIAPIARYPKVLLGFYAAFVPPLLDVLECPNFVVDWGSRTSTGKTTALRIAASVAGNPNEDATDTVLGTWDMTRVAVERRCGLLTGLPVLLDDTKKAKNSSDVGAILYGVASGQGRGRGNLEGQDRTQTWRTVLLSSGEAAAVTFTTAGGVRGRVLTIRGLPFESAEVAGLVRQLNADVVAHHGHALPRFVRAVQERRDRWGDWREAYTREVKRLSASATNNVADRLAAYFAAITFTAQLVHRVFAEAGHPLPWRYTSQLDGLWQTIAAETDEAGVDIRALHDVVSWATANRARFYGNYVRGLEMRLDPPGGWLGRWPGDKSYIAFFQDQLGAILKDRGYHPEEVFNGWKERGWLELDKEGKNKQVTWPLGGKMRMVTLKREAIDSTTDAGECLDDDSDEDQQAGVDDLPW